MNSSKDPTIDEYSDFQSNIKIIRFSLFDKLKNITFLCYRPRKKGKNKTNDTFNIGEAKLKSEGNITTIMQTI